MEIMRNPGKIPESIINGNLNLGISGISDTSPTFRDPNLHSPKGSQEVSETGKSRESDRSEESGEDPKLRCQKWTKCGKTSHYALSVKTFGRT